MFWCVFEIFTPGIMEGIKNVGIALCFLIMPSENCMDINFIRFVFHSYLHVSFLNNGFAN